MDRILVVDDEPQMRLAIKEALGRKGFGVECAPDGMEAIRKFSSGTYDLVISDVSMPKAGGMDVLREVRKAAPHVPVLLITAFGTVEQAVEAVKGGAMDFILKPFTLDALEGLVQKALAHPKESFEVKGKLMLADDPAMRRLVSYATLAAKSDATALISGESGTGKELLARYLHSMSNRKDGPFVAVNCASIPEGLLESELFGHEKGAFTGAVAQRLGKFELADSGTLLLDEISEMDLKLQAKLLRVIQEKEVERLGGRSAVPLDIRIIATTNRDMAKEVREGRFREDLFYRLNIIPLTLPPLRERADIMSMAEHFMARFCAKYQKRLSGFSSEAVDIIKGAQWKGNIRELENAIERGVLLCQGDILEAGDFGACNDIVKSAPVTVNDLANNMTLWAMEKGLIEKTLLEFDGNRTKAAQSLGISVRTLRNKLKEYGQILPE